MPNIYFVPTAEGQLVDRYTLSVWSNRSMETIRRRCTIDRYHRDGRALYIADAALAELEALQHIRTRTGELTKEARCA